VTDCCPSPAVDDGAAVRAVQATLRSHLDRPRDPGRLYEELRHRSRGPLAAVVRRHRLTAAGTCSECGGPAASSLPCAALAEVAHDLGLHLVPATG